MATVETELMSVDEFYEWVSRPENRDKAVELDEGRIVQMPPPGGFHGLWCCYIGHLLWNYVLARGKGYVLSNDTGLVVKRKPGIVRGPDIMLFDEGDPLQQLSTKWVKHLPKLIVEVLSPGNKLTQMMRRISQYLKRGVPLVWLVDPEARSVTVYRPNQPMKVRQEHDVLTGEDVLPKLRFIVSDLFAVPGQSRNHNA